jgi:hypothetical protein
MSRETRDDGGKTQEETFVPCGVCGRSLATCPHSAHEHMTALRSMPANPTTAGTTETLRAALADYRAWGNDAAKATTFAALVAEAVTRLDAIAKLCDALVSTPEPARGGETEDDGPALRLDNALDQIVSLARALVVQHGGDTVEEFDAEVAKARRVVGEVWRLDHAALDAGPREKVPREVNTSRPGGCAMTSETRTETRWTTHHMSLDVRGALLHMPKRQLATMFLHDDGRRMTADEAKRTLLDELAKGHEKLPIGDCDGFDYTTGCPGHPCAPPAQSAALSAGEGAR